LVTLSDVASRKLNEILAAQTEKVYGLRLHAMSGCCSGPSFGMSLAAEAAMPGDWEGELGGVKVLVDEDSAPLLEGASIDWVETPEASGFTIQNPKAMASTGGGCGCHGEAKDPTEAAHSHGGGQGGCGCGGH
jgi:iron-sulfur cluster assembly protein